ncbi:MAG: threonine synthase [Candidatus Heimdallarchaeota archaeon]|nr:threonine synthase [Candidatus Heimdallarchaeota archaeon]
MKITLRCINCEEEYPANKFTYRCDICSNLLEVAQQFDFDGNYLKTIFDNRLKELKLPFSSGVWRYHELILELPVDKIISRNEGNTNLYQSKLLDSYTNSSLQIKHEGENPTGSFKDRGMTVATSMANVLGFTSLACASTGNTSASMASYAASNGMNSYIFIPDGNIAYGKLSQALAYGGKTFQINGNFDDAMETVQQVCQERQIFLVNSINPFRIEGQKSIIFELLQQRDWQVPDWIVLPGGNLGNVSAFGKALNELIELDIIDKLPKIGLIQAEGANPFYQLVNKKLDTIEPMKPSTLATAIKIGNPISWKKALEVIKNSRGSVVQLSEQEILEAKAQVDRSGIGAEPASCTSIGGIKKLRQQNLIKEDDVVIAILTGNLLKDPDVTIKYHLGEFAINSGMINKPMKIENNIDEILKNLYLN